MIAITTLLITALLSSWTGQLIFPEQQMDNIATVPSVSLQPCQVYALWYHADRPGDAPERVVLPDGTRLSVSGNGSVSTSDLPFGMAVPVRVDFVLLPDEETSSPRFRPARITCITQASSDTPARIPAEDYPYVAGVPYQLHWMNFLISWYGVNEVDRGYIEGEKMPVYLFPGEDHNFIHDAFGAFLCQTPKGDRSLCDETLGGKTRWQTILQIGAETNN